MANPLDRSITHLLHRAWQPRKMLVLWSWRDLHRPVRAGRFGLLNKPEITLLSIPHQSWDGTLGWLKRHNISALCNSRKSRPRT